MRAGKSISGSRSSSPWLTAWTLGLALLLAGAAPAAALHIKGEVNANGINFKGSYTTPKSTSQWAVEVRGEDRVWPGMLLGPQGRVWARLPGLSETSAGPRLVVRHTASGEQAQVSSARRLALATGDGDWWLLESDARDLVGGEPSTITPGAGQALWAYTYSTGRDRLVRNSYPARFSGDRLGLAGAQAPSLGLVTDQKDRAVGLLAGPGAVTTLDQAREAMKDPVAPPAAPAVGPPPTPIPAESTKEAKESKEMPDIVRYLLGLIVAPVAAWLMGRMVFRATWGRMSPYKGVAVGMAVFWALMAIAEYWIWVGTREPQEALLQLTLSVGLPSLFSWTVILSNIFRRLRN